MTKKRTSPPKRDAAQTTMSISIPKELKEAIEAAAARENRSISNYMATEIMKVLSKKAGE